MVETARALSGFAGDGRGLVTACRRIVHRHPACGSLVWLAARAITSPEPRGELRESAAAVSSDPTGRQVADALPADATVVVVGWPEVGVSSLARRGDVTVAAVDTDGSADDLVHALTAADVDAWAAGPVALGATLGGLSASGGPVVVLVEADAADPTRAVAAPGSLAAAATAHALDLPVWLVAPCGRTQPEVMLDAALRRLTAGATDPADIDWDVVPVHLVDLVVRPDGALSPAEALAAPDCPAAPELFAGDVF